MIAGNLIHVDPFVLGQQPLCCCGRGITHRVTPVPLLLCCLFPVWLQRLLADAAQPPPPLAAAAPAPLVTAVMFGAPNVGDSEFAAEFDRRVNARNIEYVADIVPQLPCAGHMPICDDGSAAADAAADAADSADGPGSDSESDSESDSADDSSSDIDSDEESSWDDSGSAKRSRGSVSYARLGGRLQLEAMDMPVQQNAWRQLSTYRQVSVQGSVQFAVLMLGGVALWVVRAAAVNHLSCIL